MNAPEKGKMWYLEHVKKLHEEKCRLLIFGYSRYMQAKFNYNIPIAINAIIEKYLNKTQIFFK